MILDDWNLLAFQNYAKPLRKLEKAHNKNGNPFILSAFTDPFGNRIVRIIGGRAVKNPTKKPNKIKRLFFRRIVSFPGAYREFGKPLRRVEPDRDSPPFSIMNSVCRRIAHEVLALQFSVYQIDVIIQIVKIVREKSAASGQIDDVLNFGEAVTQKPLFADDVNLHV